MARADQVADLVGDGVARGGALVVHDRERVLGIGIDAGCQAAPLGIVDDQDRHVGAMLVAQPWISSMTPSPLSAKRHT